MCNQNKGVCSNGVCSDIGGGGDIEDPVCAASGDDQQNNAGFGDFTDFINGNAGNNNNNNGSGQATSGDGAPCNQNKGVCSNGVCSDIGGGGDLEDPICTAGGTSAGGNNNNNNNGGNNNGGGQVATGDGAPCNQNKGVCSNGVCSDIGGGGDLEDPICQA